MGLPIDHKATTSTNPLAAIVVKDDGIPSGVENLLIEHIEHFKKTQIGRYIGQIEVLKAALRGRPCCRQTFNFNDNVALIICNSVGSA